MPKPTAVVVLVLLTLPLKARAETTDAGAPDSATEETPGPAAGSKPVEGDLSLTLGGSGTQPTADNPRSGEFSSSVAGSIEPSEQWSIDLSAGYRYEGPTAASGSSAFGQSGGNVFALSAGPTWTPNDHWTADLSGSYSPQSTTLADTTLTLQTGRQSVDADAQLKSVTRTWGLAVSGDYDTAGDSAFEHSGHLSFGVTGTTTQQSINALDAKGRMIDLTSLESAYCTGSKAQSQTCKHVAALTRDEATTIHQFELGGAYALTLYEKTEVRLEGSYFLYDQDPTQVGYYSLATAGRAATPAEGRGSTRGGGELDFGGGMPLAPLLFSTTLGASHTFGDDHPLRVALNFGYGSYVANEGLDLSLALKVSLKLNAHWKLTLSAGGSESVLNDSGASTASLSGNASLTAKYRF
jgi:hypothetical protein